jgi:hypothetical protein
MDRELHLNHVWSRGRARRPVKKQRIGNHFVFKLVCFPTFKAREVALASKENLRNCKDSPVRMGKICYTHDPTQVFFCKH